MKNNCSRYFGLYQHDREAHVLPDEAWARHAGPKHWCMECRQILSRDAVDPIDVVVAEFGDSTVIATLAQFAIAIVRVDFLHEFHSLFQACRIGRCDVLETDHPGSFVSCFTREVVPWHAGAGTSYFACPSCGTRRERPETFQPPRYFLRSDLARLDLFQTPTCTTVISERVARNISASRWPEIRLAEWLVLDSALDGPA